jgi:CRP-like cAMP-binding protein
MLSFRKKDTIFTQGDTTDGLYFIQKGKVRLSMVSERGKEATLAILGERDFFGESGVAGQLQRMSSGAAITDCILLHVGKKAMMLSSGRIIFGVVPRLDDTERERLSALIKESRELRKQAERLQKWSEALQK